MQSLPPDSARALFEWALRQPAPFRAAQAAEAIGVKGGAGFGLVPVALSTHPEIAAWDGLYYTPRIMAARAEFVVRLTRSEGAMGVLAEGHRLLPFRRFGATPGSAVLEGPAGALLTAANVTIDRGDAEACYSLIGRAAYPWKGSGHLALVPGWKLPTTMWNAKKPPLQFLLRCVDFDRARYVIRPFGSWDPSPEVDEGLIDAMDSILEEPPPGPRFAARQMLQALARIWDEIDTPFGPMGPALCDAFELMDVKGRSVFVYDVLGAGAEDWEDVPAPDPEPEPLPPDPNDPAGALLAALDEAVGSWRGRSSGMSVPRMSWDEEQREIRGSVQHQTWYKTEAAVSLESPVAPLRGKCGCSPGASGCEHLVAFYGVLARELRNTGTAFSREVRAWLALTPWQVRLRGLDRALRAPEGSRAGEPAAERLVWRTSLSDYGIELAPCVQKQLKNGAWSAGKGIGVAALLRTKRELLGPQDYQVARALGTKENTYGWGRSHSRNAIDRDDLVEVFSRLAGHPRVVLGSAGSPLRVERADLKLAIETLPAGGIKLTASAGVVPFLRCARVAGAEHGFIACDTANGRIFVVECPARARDLATEVHRGGGEFPKEALGEIESRLAAIEAVAPVEIPAELAGESVPADTRTILRLEPRDPAGLDAALRVRPLPGAPALYPPGSGPARAGGNPGGKRCSAMRDLAAESERAAALAGSLGLASWTEPARWSWTTESDEEALGLVERAQAASPEELIVEWPDGKRRLTLVSAAESDLRVRIEQKNDWFSLDGEVEVDGARVQLAALIAAIRENRRFVQVSPGRWLSIAREFRERLRGLADLSLPGKSGLEVSPVAAPFVAEMVKEAGLVKACEAWKKLEKRLEAAAAMDPDPPASFTASLRDYQLDGYRWLSRLAAWGAGGCLADDMGLGKTIQALALLVDRASEGPALIVAPTSVASNWMAETARFAPTLRPVMYRETDRQAKPDEFKAGDLVIASYGLVLRDAARLEQVPWGTLILDEAQVVKNSRTQTAASIRQIPAKWRLALTGTPVENHLGDLWSLFRAVSPGLFGSWDAFRDRFAAPIERDKDAGRRQALARIVRPFVLRRSKGEVLKELPARTEIVLRAELSPEERALYDKARLAAAMSFAEPSRRKGAEEHIQVLAALTRLRQFACHPRLVLPDAPPSSAKLRLFLSTVEELREGKHRALVFSQFTSFLALAREALDAAGIRYRYLDGATPPRQRDTEIAAFQRGEGDLFLISLKAGGTGLNLTAADYVLHLDPWWNPAVEDQATDRAHRIGQTRPVTVYRLVAANTIEEKILALHGTKRELVSSILEGTDHAAKLSTEELIALIREGTAAESQTERGIAAPR